MSRQAMELDGATVGGQYEVVKRLQSGFYGVTWMARDRAHEREVCLKTFFTESSAQRKELAILRKMSEGHFSHDNLCKVLDVSVDRVPVTSFRGQVILHLQYVAFEFCSGSDLFNFLVTGPFEKSKRVRSFSEALARHYITQALLALLYLHERGVFHRDIKPENCVLDEHFNLKLTDFGTNKFLPISDDPAQVLRTATKGIGTDSYRAPEVNGIHGYDPSAADVWSLGVTLFFLVGVEAMVVRALELEQYMRSVLAPLGILFPFPVFCRKLDSCLRTEAELQQAMALNGGQPLPNDQFWEEWVGLREGLSGELRDLFNRMFVLTPSLRYTLRETVRHQWIASGHRLSPEEVRREMESRCPSGINTSLNASPRVLGNKLLGGVDQATLRQSLSQSGQDAVTEYLTDAEVWLMTDSLRQLEALQLDIVSSDIQELIMDVNYTRQLLRDLLSSPHEDYRRTLPTKDIQAPWMGSMLVTLGFLPQGHTLYLPLGDMNLTLLHSAISILDGVELAVTRSAVPVSSGESEDEHVLTQHSSIEDDVTIHVLKRSSSNPEQSPTRTSTTEGVPIATSLPRSGLFGLNSIPSHSNAVTMATSPTLDYSLPDSQESMAWTQYTDSLSHQSSQEECPEAMVSDSWERDLSSVHSIIELAALTNPREPHQYRAAAEFCKISGLLCSYGLYQVVCHEQLALYCQGGVASFSVRVVALDQQGKIGISSWCFHGNEEWQTILGRISRDMAPQR